MKLMPGATIEIDGRTYRHRGNGSFEMIHCAPDCSCRAPARKPTIKDDAIELQLRSRVDYARNMLKQLTDLKVTRDAMLTALSCVEWLADEFDRRKDMPRDDAVVSVLECYLSRYGDAKSIVEDGDRDCS